MEQSLSPASPHAAIYVRTGVPDDTSVAEQIRLCRAAAADRGYDVQEDAVFIDNGVSGATTEREAWCRLQAHVERSNGPDFSVLLISDRSRLGRFADPRMHDYLIVRLQRHGVRVVFAGEREQQLETVGAYIVDQIGAMAERRRCGTACRLVRGRERAWERRAGRYVSGPAPYGFELVPEHPTLEGWREAVRTGNWRLAPATDGSVAAVQRIFAGVADGTPLRALATELDGSQAPLPRAARSWTPRRIRSIARNPIYVGDLVSRRPGPAGGSLTFPAWLPDPPVTRELFARVQHLLESRRG